jgi:hypothetical protein
MASGRDYLQSIMTSLGQLQNLPDAKLDNIIDGLRRVDFDLQDAVEYVHEPAELHYDHNQGRTV